MTRDRWILAFALGTFHAVIVTLLLVLGLYLTTDLGHTLASFSTVIGLAVFGALWATSVYCTQRGMLEAGLTPGASAPAAGVLRNGMAWGAWNGMSFAWCLIGSGFAALLPIAIIDDGPDQVLGVVIFAMLAFALGSVVAAVIGAAAGILLAALDLLLLSAARSMIGAGDSSH